MPKVTQFIRTTFGLSERTKVTHIDNEVKAFGILLAKTQLVDGGVVVTLSGSEEVCHIYDDHISNYTYLK